jgi:hypothetical protein
VLQHRGGLITHLPSTGGLTVSNGTDNRQGPEPQANKILATPATVAACAADRAGRDTSGEAVTQRGSVYASAQGGIPRTAGGQ